MAPQVCGRKLRPQNFINILSRCASVFVMNKNTNDKSLVPEERIEQIIFIIRNQKVILDSDLAALYGVETKVLNQAIKRNIERFPAEFMFQLTKEETGSLILQFAISNKRRGGRRTFPYAFTEQGVAMLSGILNSDKAINMNIAIMRAFVEVRKVLLTHIADPFPSNVKK